MRTRLRRRSLLRGAALALSAAATRGRSAIARPSKKMSQADVGYQPVPQGGFSCAICTLFRPPSACAIVEGDVSPIGWCRYFAMPD